MHRLRLSIGDMRVTGAMALLALALLARVLVPSGWMPTVSGGYAITLCTGMGAVEAWVDQDGKINKGKPADSRPEQPCAFSGFSAALDLPSLDMLAALPTRAPLAEPALSQMSTHIGHGLAAPPPLSTGPPATL